MHDIAVDGAPRDDVPLMREPNDGRHIEARPFRDYRPTPKKGEPILLPGGWMVLVAFAANVALSLWVSAYLHPPVRAWVKSFTGPG